MKHYIKSAMDTLAALDFQLDHEDRKLRTDRWVYHHANEPDARLTLNHRMSEPAARTVVQRARQIVGLSTSETGKAKRQVKVNGREKAERASEHRRAEEARRVAGARAIEKSLTREVDAVRSRRQELDRLLRGGPGSAVEKVRVDRAALLTVEQVADATGLTDKAVRRAVDSGALEAYMCPGGVVKIKGADVSTWMSGAA